MDSLLQCGFDWDDANRDKCTAHGMAIEEIESVFAGFPLVGPDPFPAEIETRLRAFGRTAMGRPAFVVFFPAAGWTDHIYSPDFRQIYARQGGATL